MRPPTRRAWLSPLASLALFALICCLPSACARYTAVERTGFKPEQAETRPFEYYHEALAGLPLRIDTERWHLDVNEPGRTERAIVREMHVLRDLREPKNDVLLFVHASKRMYAVGARDMTVLWKGLLDKRTLFNPVMTDDSIYFIDEFGDFQKFNRYNGELADKDRFGIGRRPATQPIANDTHVIVPTSHQNAIQGWGDSATAVTAAAAPQNWLFPSRWTGEEVRFQMVTLPPTADTEAVYLVSNNYLYGIDAQTGGFRFRTPLGREGVIRTPPVLKRDIIYVGSDSQLFAVSRSGEVLWSYTTEGPVTGQIFAMDDKVYYNTLTIGSSDTKGDKYRNLALGRTTQPEATVDITFKPANFHSISFMTRQVPIFDDVKFVDGDPNPIRTDKDKEPVLDIPIIEAPHGDDWSIPNQGQQVLLKTGKYLFVLYEEWNIPYDNEQLADMRASGLAVKPDEERVYSKRILRVLDVNTGEVVNKGGEIWSFDVSMFPFIIGSMREDDRAIYFGTKDGHVFKAFARD